MSQPKSGDCVECGRLTTSVGLVITPNSGTYSKEEGGMLCYQCVFARHRFFKKNSWRKDWLELWKQKIKAGGEEVQP